MKVMIVKPFRHGFRHGFRTFMAGEVGEVVEVEYPLTFHDTPVFDYYVKFPGYPPVGVHKMEVKEVPSNEKGS